MTDADLPGDVLGSTPLSDAYATQRVLWFSDVPAWAREIEGRAAFFEVTLAYIAPKIEIAVVGKARAQLRAFLTPRTGRLARALDRPPEQLELDSPARRMLNDSAARLFALAANARDLAPDIEQLWTEIVEERERQELMFPHLTADLLGRGRLEEAHVLGIASRASLERARFRFEAVRDRLRALERAALSLRSSASSISDDVVAQTPYTIPEMQAFLALERRERSRSHQRSDARERSRQASTVQLSALASVASERNVGTPGAIALDAYLQRVAWLDGKSARPGTEEPIVWSGALGAATRAVHARRSAPGFPSGLFRWRPLTNVLDLPPMVSPVRLVGGMNWGAVSIGNEIICLSKSDLAGIRVFNAGIELGQTIDLVPIADSVIGESDPIRADIEFLFKIPRSGAGWYETTRRAKVEVIGTDGERWYARLVRQGTLRHLDPGATRAAQPAGPSVRLLSATYVAPTSLRSERIHLEGAAGSLAGIERALAHTDVEDREIAVAHYSSDETDEDLGRALVQERELFQTLSTSLASAGQPMRACAPEFVALGSTAQLSNMQLYRMQADLAVLESEIAEAWIRESEAATFAALRSVAQIFLQAWDHGWSVGSCLTPMFAFGPTWDAATGSPMPSARLLTAPFAERLGSRYAANRSDSQTSEMFYPRLGLSALPKRVRLQEEATAAVDLFGLLSLSFEWLARGPIEYGQGHRASWGGIIRVAGDDSQFRASQYVLRAAVHSKTGEGQRSLLAMMRAIAKGLLISFDECSEQLMRER